jgi:DNA replication protein DnaC
MSEPTKAGDALKIESQDAACPDCGGPSIAIRYAPPAYLTEAVRKRLDPERSFVPQRCNVCIARIERERTERERAEKCDRALAQLDVPALYRDATLTSFETGIGDATLARAKAFAEHFISAWPDVAMIAVFAGGCGTGKGHLAWAIAKELASSRGVLARVCVLSDVIRDLREAWSSREDGPSEAARLAKYRGTDLLVIDEISRHAFYGQPQQHLYDLVAWREVRLKPTILTTNESGDELAGVLGPALSSRAAGWGGFIQFGNTDYRVLSKMRRVG